ncbi:MAG: transglycosylase domain-containing protein [Actinomycetia bacterium]|nr:transglycosylase domain-containing protein [Actinomycetes bacterium]
MPYISRNARSHHRRGHGARKIIISLLAAALIVAGLTGAAGAAFVSNSLTNPPLPDWKKSGAFDAPQPTRIVSADGKLLARLYLQNRTSIEATQMGKYLREATVAVEDERFYQHGGIDPAGIVRAALTSTGGGSTLTQQYVRQTILSEEATQQTLTRKVREAYLAMQVEKKYRKDEVLTMYLNTVYYGEGAYGVQAAAQTYFSKSAANLTLPEAALIAGMPQRPSKTSPYEYPKEALARRNHVLDRMLANNYIKKKEHDEAVKTPIALKRMPEPTNGFYAAQYFVTDVIKQLKNNPAAFGITKDQITGGGLTVKTSLNYKMQTEAEASVRDAIGDEGPEAALVTINPKNGWVQAMVGGRNFAKNQVNLANNVQVDPTTGELVGGRQPGSTFKAFTLTTAIKNGMSPEASVNGSAVKIPTEDPKGYWEVQNSEGQSRGQISVAQATYGSVNGAYARIEMALGSLDTEKADGKTNARLGAEKVAEVAKSMGVVTLPLPANPSLTLGGDAVTVQDIASGFATLANNGVYCPVVKIVSITDKSGQPIYNSKDDPAKAPTRVLTPSVVCAVNEILQGVVTGGTATTARISGRQIAGKTGTTNESTNLWFTGFTPNFCTSIWRGWRDVDDTVRINGRMGYGGSACGPIWKDYAQKVFADLPNEDFPSAPAPPYDNSKFKFFGSSEEAPSVVGMDYQQAYDLLIRAGFSVSWIEVAADAPRGTIIAQSVRGNNVTLTVSLGGGSNATTETP